MEHLELPCFLVLLLVTLSFQWTTSRQEHIFEFFWIYWIVPESQPCNRIVMSYFLPPVKELSIEWKFEKWYKQEILIQFRYVSRDFLDAHTDPYSAIFLIQLRQWWCIEESNLSPGIGHSGIGASFPILIVMSLGWMRLFNFPICKHHQALKAESSNKFPHKCKLWTTKY